MAEWKILQVIIKIDGKRRSALEGTCVPVSWIAIPYICFLYGGQAHKSSVLEKTNVKKIKCFKKLCKASNFYPS